MVIQLVIGVQVLVWFVCVQQDYDLMHKVTWARPFTLRHVLTLTSC